MKLRIITAIWALALILLIIIFSAYVLPYAMAFCAVISIYELLRCIKLHKNYFISIPLYIVALLLPFVPLIPKSIASAPVVFLSVALVLILYFFLITIFSRGKFDIKDASFAFMTSFYILSGFVSVVILRNNVEFGEHIFILVFAAAWVTDTFAYFVGVLFGKHKLIPHISPKKTIEGSIGGIIGGIIGFILFGVIIKAFIYKDATIDYVALAFAGLITSISSQIGDLAMSAIKRKFEIKDFGRFFPGHGGMLDRFDSTIPVGLILVIITTVVQFIRV